MLVLVNHCQEMIATHYQQPAYPQVLLNHVLGINYHAFGINHARCSPAHLICSLVLQTHLVTTYGKHEQLGEPKVRPQT